MNINWYGQGCFKIVSQKSRNGSVNILINPPEKESGLRSPKLEADIILFSNPEDKKISEVSGKESFLVTGPGEYDVKEVYIQGIYDKKNTIYTIETEGIRICHLGKFSQRELTSQQTEIIGEIDILMIPVGGGEVIAAKEAIKIMTQIEPKITLPMYYKIPKLKKKLEGVDKFLKGMGKQTIEFQDKLVIKHKDLSQDGVEIVVLKP